MSLEEKVARLLRAEVLAMDAYHVQNASGLLKLDAMENPYTWPEVLQKKWLERLRQVPINRYPDATAAELKVRLRAACKVPDGMDIMLGNGSDEIIQILILGLARPGAVILAPEPTFVMYRNLSLVAGVDFVGVPLCADNFSLDGVAMLAAVQKHKPAVTFLARPNNPTGTLFDRESVASIIESSPGLVVVDEAYHAFAEDSFMDGLKDYDNLLVMRTLSKQGLAALRLGFLAGRPEWLHEFDKLRLPYNINSLTQASIAFILEHSDVLEEQAAKIRAERENLFKALDGMKGVTAWPSRSNFILIRIESKPGPEVFEGLKGQGVLVKNLHGADPSLDNCLRVTVSTPEENARFLEALEAAL
ncbi:MAG: histidinol-phosphate transaminase [Gammaproteobacteria bacterium]|jgi:histidinol-phosphate aminotransferase